MIKIKHETVHAKFSPSSAHRWLECPASLQYESGESSVYALKGTAAHWVLATVLDEGKKPEDFLGQEILIEPENFKVKVNDEMVDAVEDARTWLHSLPIFQEAIPNRNITVEKLLVSKNKEFFGTADVVVINSNSIGIYDFKYGKGVKVDAEQNVQLLCYAALLYSMGYKPAIFELGIMQPRLGHFDVWQVNSKQVRNWAKEKLVPVLTGKKSGYFASEEICKFCVGKGKCKAHMQFILAKAQTEFQEYTEKKPDTLTDEEIAGLLEIKDDVLKFFDELTKRAIERIMAGHEVLNWKVVEGRSWTRWKDEAEADKFLAKYLGEERFEKKLLSPTKAKEVLDKAKRKMLERLIEKPAGKPTLARADDKRPALTPASDFREYIEED